MPEHQAHITHRWVSFTELTIAQLYTLLQLRQQIFVVEQNCPYLDADGLDQNAWHLLAHQRTDPGQPELIACLRVLPPQKKYSGPAIGRLATARSVRGQGIAGEMMNMALQFSADHFPGQPITISAQLYLQKFYRNLGFTAISEPYDDDSILHIDMLYNP